MEIPKEINISEIKRHDMYYIDGTSRIKYSALVNGMRVIHGTDGWVRPHMSTEEWAQKVVQLYIERYNELYEMNK
jgi:hypothetical protein